jgi:Uma2 family endonuclease
MRALMLELPETEELLADRRKKGSDRWDEVWDGVLHMVPPPNRPHQSLSTRLLIALQPVATGLDLELTYETGVFRPGTGDRDYRTPDLVVYDSRHASDRGVEGKAELVVEVLSPGDESREKLGFYAACGVQETLLIDPRTRQVELFVLHGHKYRPKRGALRSAVLGVTFAKVPGPKLRVTTPFGVTDL